MTEPKQSTERRTYWLDKRINQRKVFWALMAICATTVIVDALIEKHGHYDYELWTGFHGVFGFFASVLIVLSAKALRPFVKRSEDYYDE